jgi:hypothetical protein
LINCFTEPTLPVYILFWNDAFQWKVVYLIKIKQTKLNILIECLNNQVQIYDSLPIYFKCSCKIKLKMSLRCHVFISYQNDL